MCIRDRAQLDRISRYSGANPDTAPLHNLGGEQWAKAKKKAAEKVRDVAAELLEIQAKRHARQGLAIDVDRAMYEPVSYTHLDVYKRQLLNGGFGVLAGALLVAVLSALSRLRGKSHTPQA